MSNCIDLVSQNKKIKKARLCMFFNITVVTFTQVIISKQTKKPKQKKKMASQKKNKETTEINGHPGKFMILASHACIQNFKISYVINVEMIMDSLDLQGIHAFL